MNFYKLALVTALAALCLGSKPAFAKMDVVAANQDLAWVATAVGGKEVSVDYLAPSSQDPHQIDPRPSQVAKLSRAKLAIRIGLDLDIWFDSLLRNAGNANILINAKGYVDASRGVRLLEIPSGKLDPSQGDIHIFGNPHYFFGPSNIPAIARNVRDGLKRVDPAKAATYDANYDALVKRIQEALPRWRAKMKSDQSKSVVAYHKSLVYFLADFNLREIANVEPRPGLEPTVGHLSTTATLMKQQSVKVILTESYRPRRWSDLLAKQSGGTVVVLPAGVGAEKGITDYFTLMDAWVDRVSAAL